MQSNQSLAEQFPFSRDTPILDNLTKLTRAIDARFVKADALAAQVDSVVTSIEQVALDRLNETFTPLIVEAQQRLNQFGAAFNANSHTSLAIPASVPTPIIFQIDESQRSGYSFSDYVALRYSADTSKSMLIQVGSYDRPSGQISGTVIQIGGSGTFADWQVRIAAAPDLAHAGRTDNPHATTAHQVGAYTMLEVDAIAAATVTAAQTYVSGLGFMRQNQNLADIIDAATARHNLHVPFADADYTAANRAGDTFTGNVRTMAELKVDSGILRLSVDGTRYLQWNGTLYNVGGNQIWHAGNFSPSAKADYGTNITNFVNNAGYITNVASALGYTPMNQAGGEFTGGFNVDGLVNARDGFYFALNTGIKIEYRPDIGAIWTPNSFWVGGNFVVSGSKAFRIPHPTIAGRDLVHICLEGPEAAVFYRGKGISRDGSYVTIRLPHYFSALVDEASATVQVTAIGPGAAPMSVSEVSGGQFTVYPSDRRLEQRFHWRVEAARRDIKPVEVEPLKETP